MIIDSSAVLAVLYREPDAERYEMAIAAAQNCRMSVANVLETSIVVEGRGGASDKNIVNAFRTKCLRELKKIKLAGPGLNYATAPGVLILHPSTPVIAPSDHPQLAS